MASFLLDTVLCCYDPCGGFTVIVWMVAGNNLWLVLCLLYLPAASKDLNDTEFCSCWMFYTAWIRNVRKAIERHWVAGEEGVGRAAERWRGIRGKCVCVCVCDIMFCAVLMTSIAGFSYRSGISAQPVNTVTHTNTRCTHTRTHIFSVTPLVHIGKTDDLKV